MPVVPVALAALSTVAPPVAAEIGFRMWRSLGRPEAVHPRDLAVHERALRGTLDLDGTPVATYTWGDGPEVVLLVHGWRSRASRFAGVVAALDGPGRTIVAHSFGVLSAFVAVREGVAVDRIVGIAGLHSADEIVDQFCRDAGLGARAKRGLRSRIERRFFAGIPDLWRRFRAELDPADTVTSVLLVHSRDDTRVAVNQSELIAEAHTGPVRLVLVDGLGHNRILGDRAVLDEVAAFAAAGATPSRANGSRRSSA